MLKDDRLILDPMSLEDLMDLDKIERYDMTDFEWSEPFKRAVAMKVEKMKTLDRKRHPLYTYFLIVERSTNKGLGAIGFKGMTHGTMEVGYGISSKTQGRGYMTSALKMLVDWTFEYTFCHKITACGVLKDNLGSQRVLEKNAFEVTKDHGSVLDYHLDNPHFSLNFKSEQEAFRRKGAYAIVYDQGAFAVAAVRDSHFLVGGGVEQGEDLVQCLQREAQEEIGYSLKNMTYLTSMTEYSTNRDKSKTLLLDADIYLADLGDASLKPLEEDHALAWIRPEEIDGKMWLDYQKLAMKKILRGDLYGLS